MFCQLLKTCEEMSEEMSENKPHLKSTFGIFSSAKSSTSPRIPSVLIACLSDSK